jgi:hypothetical protein
MIAAAALNGRCLRRFVLNGSVMKLARLFVPQVESKGEAKRFSSVLE